MFFSRLRTIPFITIVLLVPLSNLAMTIDGYSQAKHDRFGDQTAFIASSYDLSGVALSSDGRWATLIAPNIFLTANHFKPGVNQTIRFYTTNDSSGRFIERTVTSTRQKIGSTDLFINTLNAPVPENVEVYSYATESVPLITAFYPYFNDNTFHIGRSPGSSPVPFDVGIGRNILDTLRSSISTPNIDASGPAVEITQDGSGDPNFVAHETHGQVGDSGGPLFVDPGDGSLRLIGIAWYITTAPSTGFSSVGDQSASIDSFLSTHELPYQPLAPDTLTASRINASTVDLSWVDVSNVETSYVIERATSSTGPWTALGGQSPDTESFQDTAAPSGDVYYRLRAENNGINSAWVEASALTSYTTYAMGIDWGENDSSALGDANGDGISNLIAFAFGFDPQAPAPKDALLNPAPSGASLFLTYHRNPQATDLTFELQQGTNLVTPDWQEVVIDGTTVTETDLGPVDDDRLIQIELSLPASSGGVFFQIEVESP